MKPFFATLATVMALASAHADVSDRLYDFTDAYYLRNGVNPAAIGGRRQADGVLAVQSAPNFSFQRDVRALFTLGGWRDNGSPMYWTVMGGLNGAGFTNNAAGVKARELADRSAEYIFPMRGTNPTGLGQVRQPFMLDTSNGYFSNNPLGLWIHIWVNYTDAAFNTSNGRKELADMAKKNGVSLDGTPTIRTKSDIEKLFSKGLVTKTVVPLNDPLRYAICPAIKDPTDGGIAPDQFLATVRRPDGSAFDVSIERNFESLRLTGRWSN